jgi:adenylate cyclase
VGIDAADQVRFDAFSVTQRKLAAILSADVVGYSRLMSEDEDETVRRLGAYRTEIATLVGEHGGRVVDFTGDNFLGEFPTATGAVEAAVEIQRVLEARNAAVPAGRAMEFRIGVHLGEVRVEGERLYGDGVNIAARLEALAEPGGICISAAVHQQVRGRLDVEFGDLGRQTLKNIAEPVGVFAVHLEGRAAERVARPGRRRLVVAAAIVLVLCVAVWAAWPRIVEVGLEASLLPGDRPALPDKPSIVVLPFDSLSDDPEQEYFADGLTEDITTALSGTNSLFVIARNSAFTYKGKPTQVSEIAEQLGVRYVLEGSVRRSGETVRATAQLIDARNGFHVWSGQYDRGLEDIFEVQSEIAERIIGAVGVEISEVELERIRRVPTTSVTAYQALARAQHHFFLFTRADMAEAQRWAERAVELDPNYADAVSLLGSAYAGPYTMLWTNDRRGFDDWKALEERALTLDPGLSGAYQALAVRELTEGHPERALPFARRAAELAPSDWNAKAIVAAALVQSGHFVESMQLVKQVMRLNPRFEGQTNWLLLVGGIHASLGQIDEAVALWERSLQNPDVIQSRLDLIAYHARRGNSKQVGQLVDEVLRINPQLTWERIRGAGLQLAVGDPLDRKRIFLEAGIPE